MPMKYLLPAYVACFAGALVVRWANAAPTPH